MLGKLASVVGYTIGHTYVWLYEIRAIVWGVPATEKDPEPWL